MFAKRPARCRLTLFVTAVAIGIGTARAHQMLYDQDGYRLAVGNVDTGAGNVNTDAPLQAPFPPFERRTTRDWFEGFIKPFAELETPFFDFGHTYALVSVVGALTRGNGDATSSLAPQGARSTTSDAPQHAALEDAVIGWHSGNLFADSLGEDAVELSGGRQAFVLGDSFLIGAGVVNGFGRAAFYLQPRASFDRGDPQARPIVGTRQAVPSRKPSGPGFDAGLRPAEDQVFRSRPLALRSERAGAGPKDGWREAGPDGGTGRANDARQKRDPRSMVGRFRLSPCL